MSSTKKSQISMVDPQDRRRRFFPKKLMVVNADFQFRYVRVAVVIGIASTIVTGVVLLYPLYVFEYLRVPRAMPAPIIWGACVAILLNIASISMVGLMISHKIAGPMYAICRRLRAIELGDFTGRLKLRKNDELGYIARNLNRALDSLVQATEKDIVTVQKTIAALQQDNPQVDVSSLEKLKNNLQERVAEKKDF